MAAMDTYVRTCAPTTSFAIANWFIDKAKQNGEYLNLTKLQCLSYLTYGWYIAYYDIPLFGDSIFVGELYPEIESLRRMFKGHAMDSIGVKAVEFYETIDGHMEKRECSIFTSDDNLTDYLCEEKHQEEKKIVGLLDLVWNTFSSCSDAQLVFIVTKPGTPWRKIADQYRKKRRNMRTLRAIIDPDEIYNYFVDTIVEE
jgi:uncharacterized phage-associated protein